jgi:hypothetical protein
MCGMFGALRKAPPDSFPFWDCCTSSSGLNFVKSSDSLSTMQQLNSRTSQSLWNIRDSRENTAELIAFGTVTRVLRG